MSMPEHNSPEKKHARRRRKRRLSIWEMIVMGAGYLAIAYLLVLALGRLFVWLAG